MGLFDFFKRKKKKELQDIETETHDILIGNESVDNNADDTFTPIDCNYTKESDIIEEVTEFFDKASEDGSDGIEEKNYIKDTLTENQSSSEEQDETNQNSADILKASDDAISDQHSKTTYTGRFEINKTKDGQKYFFNLYASNSVGIATSQVYSSAQSALIGIKSVIINSPKAPIEDQTLKSFTSLPYPKWEIYIDKGGRFRFRLNAPNGSCICHSQGYSTKTACKNGINSIIKSSRNAKIDKNYLTK